MTRARALDLAAVAATAGKMAGDRRTRLRAVLTAAWPLVVMTALQALIAGRVVRYNGPMIGPRAVFVAVAEVGIVTEFDWIDRLRASPQVENEGA